MANFYLDCLAENFLGKAPKWYKLSIIAFLLINPLSLYFLGSYFTGWLLVVEFIFTLALSLKCYPLQPGGLLALEAVFLGMTSPQHIKTEVELGFEVILLLMFMVAGISFMREMLLFFFTKIFIRLRSKLSLALIFCLMSTFLSAFLDALTVTAVIITVLVGFYTVYYKVVSGKQFDVASVYHHDTKVEASYQKDLEQFRACLRSLVMHGAVGTALGGVLTLVGEPQNILIASIANWNFLEFFFRMSPVTVPVLATGIVMVVTLEKTGWFGYGAKLPDKVREILIQFDKSESEKLTVHKKVSLVVQGIIGIWLIFALTFHLAEVGLVGLSVIILVTALIGIVDEHSIGRAFVDAMPFTALLVVFFVIVAVINDAQLFYPITAYVLSLHGADQISVLYLANGILSIVSDNVFVASVYINQMFSAFNSQAITRETFDFMAVAINTGTNIPSIATPNGQAAFLFLLTSSLAPLIGLSYGRMLLMALPYTVVLTVVGYFSVVYLLQPTTLKLYEWQLI